MDPAKTNKVQIDSGTYLTGFLTLWGTVVMQSKRGRKERQFGTVAGKGIQNQNFKCTDIGCLKGWHVLTYEIK